MQEKGSRATGRAMEYFKRRRFLLVVLAVLGAATVGAVLLSRQAMRELPSWKSIEEASSVEESQVFVERSREAENIASLGYILATVFVIAAAGLVVFQIGKRPRVRAWREKALEALPTQGREGVFVAFAFGVGLVLSGMLLVRSNGLNFFPSGDEITYLEAATKAKNAYGALGFPLALYSGRWGDQDKHPLYVWAIMPFAGRSLRFFVYARTVSSIFAAASVLVVFFVCRRLFGTAAAVTALFLFAMNKNFIEKSSTIAPDMLLVSLVTLSLYFTIRGFQKERSLAAGGAFAGLAYLTSLGGLCLPAAFFLAGAIRWRLAAFRKKHFYFYFIAFLVAASPLVSRNVLRYGNPLSDSKFSRLWLDSRRETESAAYMEGRTGLKSFLAGRDMTDVAAGFLEGGEMASNNAALTISPLRDTVIVKVWNNRPFNLRLRLGWLVLLAAGGLVLLDLDANRRVLMLVLFVVVFVPMSWYAKIAIGPSQVLPYMPLVMGYVGQGIVSVVNRWQYRSAVAVAACLVGFYAAADRFGFWQPLDMKSPPQDVTVLADWLEANLEKSDIFLIGPDDRLRYTWYRKPVGRSRFVPNTNDVRSLIEAAEKSGARYVVISKGLYGSRLLQFSNAIWLEGQDLVAAEDIRGWRLVFNDPVGAVDYLVFELTEEPSKTQGEKKDDGKGS